MPAIGLDTHIRFWGSLFPPVVLQQALSALRIPNPAKQVALREKLWGARDLADEIEMYFRDGDAVVLPRGFYASLLRGLQAYQIPIEWQDDRRYYEFFPLTTAAGEALEPIKLRDYQEPAVQALVSYEQGIYEATTGAGKTVVALEALRRVDQPTLIIVEKTTLAEQWREQIRSKLGAAAGYVGESETSLEPITVALRQTLWARFEELSRPSWDLLGLVTGAFFDLWGTVILDECHHAPAETLQDLLQRLPARYRWGVSATPERDETTAPLTQAIIGPILHRTTDEDAGESLVTPSVRVLTSDFEFDYHPTYEEERIDAAGEVVISRKTGRPIVDVVRNNYNAMMSALCADDDRNALIAHEAMEQALAGHHVLIVSRRKEHLRALERLILTPMPYMLTGGDSAEEIVRDIARATEGTILLSTVAEEGLDIPKLDRVVLAYPFRNTEVVKQPIGRVMRSAPGKTDAIVIDIKDPNVGLLKSQHLERVRRLYHVKGWHVDVVEKALV